MNGRVMTERGRTAERDAGTMLQGYGEGEKGGRRIACE